MAAFPEGHGGQGYEDLPDDRTLLLDSPHGNYSNFKDQHGKTNPRSSTATPTASSGNWHRGFVVDKGYVDRNRMLINIQPDEADETFPVDAAVEGGDTVNKDDWIWYYLRQHTESGKRYVVKIVRELTSSQPLQPPRPSIAQIADRRYSYPRYLLPKDSSEEPSLEDAKRWVEEHKR